MVIKKLYLTSFGKFDNLDDFDTPFNQEFQSKMNAAANDDTFKPDVFPTPGQAFKTPEEDEDSVPF